MSKMSTDFIIFEAFYYLLSEYLLRPWPQHKKIEVVMDIKELQHNVICVVTQNCTEREVSQPYGDSGRAVTCFIKTHLLILLQVPNKYLQLDK